MGGGNLPAAELAGFVLEKTQAHDSRDIQQQIGEAQFRRRIVGRVAAKNEKRLHRSGLDGGGEIGDGRGGFFSRGQTEDRRAMVPQRLVEPKDQGLHPGGLEATHGDDAAAQVGQQVIGAFGDPLIVKLRLARRHRAKQCGQAGIAGLGDDLLRELAGEFPDERRFAAIAVIGQPARVGKMVFDHVEAVHGRAFLVRIAPRKETGGKADALVAAAQKFAVQRQHNVSPLELRQEPNPGRERGGNRLGCLGIAQRLVFAPDQAGRLGFKFRPQAVARG